MEPGIIRCLLCSFPGPYCFHRSRTPEMGVSSDSAYYSHTRIQLYDPQRHKAYRPEKAQCTASCHGMYYTSVACFCLSLLVSLHTACPKPEGSSSRRTIRQIKSTLVSSSLRRSSCCTHFLLRPLLPPLFLERLLLVFLRFLVFQRLQYAQKRE